MTFKTQTQTLFDMFSVHGRQALYHWAAPLAPKILKFNP
jgi:hypothetical protein